jgi:thiamine pyrophosphokinase
MRKYILAILVTFITMMAASAEWKTTYDSEDCGSYGIVRFAYGYDDDPDMKTTILLYPDEVIDVTIKNMKFKVKTIMKDIAYTKGCEYAKVYGQCLFQNSLGIIDWIFLQPNGYYTVITLK